MFTKIWKYPAIENPYKAGKASPITVEEVTACTIVPPESLGYLGWVRGLGCDSLGNLYIWDDAYTAVWKFSSTGKLLWRNKYDSSHSIAQIHAVRGAFAVSASGEVCIGDFPTQRLIVLDDAGNVVHNFKIAIKPGTVTFGQDGSLYVAGFGFMYQGPYIYRYSAKGELIRQFCDRDSLSRLGDWSGNTGRLATDRHGNIYYGFYYPYRVVKFSSEGDSIMSISRSVPQLEPPKQIGGVIRSKAGLRGLLILPDETIVVELFTDSTVWGFDLYSPRGEWLKYISGVELPDKIWYRYWAMDPQYNFYFDIPSKEWQEVVKYKFVR